MKPLLFAVATGLAAPAVAQNVPAAQPVPAEAAGDPPGGYAPPPAPTPSPGVPVIFQPAPPPGVAFPAPPPLASYPPCRRGQFDKCVQRNSPK